MLDIRQKLALSHTIALQFIGDENARHVQQPLQKTLEEALRRPGAAAGLHQNVKHDAVLIDGAPEIMLFTVDPNEDLVQVPFVTGPGSAPRKIVREARAKLQTPSPDALIRNKDAALRQEQLDISKAQAEYVVEPDRVADSCATIRIGKLCGARADGRAEPERRHEPRIMATLMAP